MAGGTDPTYCAGDTFNPFVGQTLLDDCQTCNASAVPRYSSYQGADYCDVPYINTACPSGEQRHGAGGLGRAPPPPCCACARR